MIVLAKAGSTLTDDRPNELLVGQAPASKNVRTGADKIVEVRHQATTDDSKAD
jgi:hypothetical protein